MPDATSENLTIADADRLAQQAQVLRERVREVIVGQADAVEHLLVATFCQGHTLLVGVPGLAKTLLVRTLAAALDLEHKRIQFTPDMMPADVTGAEVLETDPATGERTMRFVAGPVFTNILLADEINRTPPRTQAALLEAMAERQVSAGGQTRPLPRPFVVVATQNPIEQEGTYPLPEAQLDRFMFALRLEYPRPGEELRIAMEEDEIAERLRDVRPVFGREELLRVRALLAQTPVSEHVAEYAVSLARATRPQDTLCPQSLRRCIQWGAGPRAGQVMLLGARCLALMEGEPTPGVHHVQRIAPAALRHRVVLSYAASAEGVDAEQVIERVLRETPISLED
jgi:MoxR-like ATPase